MRVGVCDGGSRMCAANLHSDSGEGLSVKDKILYSSKIVLVILWIQPSAYLKVNIMNYYKK